VILADVNVLIYAHREDVADHPRFRKWLETVIEGPRPRRSRRLSSSVAFLREQPNAIIVAPGQRHWSIFTDLCATAAARGDLTADAFFAALAIECGCEWVTTDRDFSRFPGLRWRHPF
jgi:uncharacterized protein